MTATAIEMRKRSCSICGKHSNRRWLPASFDLAALDGFAFASRKLPEYMRFSLGLCPSCDLVFADQVPDMQWFQSSYMKAQFDAGSESRYAARTYALELQRILPNLTERRSALDIGAGDGAFLTQLIQAGFEQVIGVEPSHEPVRCADPSIHHLLRNDFFRVTDFEPQSFNLITCFQTLEHLEDPLSLLRSAHTLLRPGGILLTVAHNFRAPMARLLGRRSPIYDIEHLQLFSPTSLQLLYEKAGFLGIDVQSLKNTYPLVYWARLLPLPKAPKRALLAYMATHKLGQRVFASRVGNMVSTGVKP